MVDLLPTAAELLAHVGAQIALGYTDLEAEMPLVVLQEVTNTADVVCEHRDLYTTVGLQLDCYHHDEERARLLAIDTSRAMTGGGFHRISTESFPEDNLYRVTMRFTAKHNEDLNAIFG